MCELVCEESWVLKNWCFWTVVLEKTLESPLDCKEIQPVHSKGDQPWDFFGRTDAKAETPVLWPPHAKSWLTGKDSDAGRDWGQEEKGMTEDEMVGWHHGLDGRESEWTAGDGDGQGGLACCDSWGHKESDMTGWLNWTEQLLGRKDITNLDSILKSRDITLPTKVHLVKAMVFPVVMYGCESWTIKKAERRRIDAFELWCWRRLLRVSWTIRRSNLSILKEINPEYSLEGLMLKLNIQYFGYLMRRTDIWKEPGAGNDWWWEKGKTKAEVLGWYHQLNGHEFE